MITFQNVSKKYNTLQVLKNIDLTLSKGECVAMIGPNGCGKTTLIKTILGLVNTDSGDVSFDGKNIQNDFSYRKRIGYMPQIGKYPENMTIGEIIEMIKKIRSDTTVYDLELYEQYKIHDLLHKKMRTLSGGTTQKVSSVLAFLFNPDMYILDEPTAGLDPIAAEILKEKVKQKKAEGKLILITSHLLNELDELVSEIVFMQEGNVLFHLPIEQIRIETGEERSSKAIASLLKKNYHG